MKTKNMLIIQNNALRRIAILAMCLIFVSIGAASISAQDIEQSEQDQPSQQIDDQPSKPEAPDKVDIKPAARDDEIATRLREILEATKWFKEPTVEVDDGVAFLAGIAKEDEYKQWATELATNTQDVAAVVNRMKLSEKSIWDFSSAFAELRNFQASTIQAIPFILFGLVVLVITWLLARVASFIADKALHQRMTNNLLRWVATRAVMLPILIFGIYLVLRVSGLTQLALTVLGGTGLIGLIIGIAFQDIAENFLASILISVQKPFRINDLVEIGDYTGIIQRVTTRGTTLMTPDGNLVQVPNAQIYKSTIINYTASPDRRISFDIGIGYDDPASEAQQIVLDSTKEHTATLNDPAPKVLIDTLGAATVNLRVFFWIDGSQHDFHSVRSSVMRIAKQALQRRGISLPDEAREVIFPNGVPVVMNEIKKSSPNETAQNGESTKPTDSGSRNRLPSEKCASQPVELAESEAEGNMRSETDDLKRQAKKSWLPGEGSEVLVDTEDGDDEVGREQRLKADAVKPYSNSPNHEPMPMPTETMAKQTEDAREI